MATLLKSGSSRHILKTSLDTSTNPRTHLFPASSSKLCVRWSERLPRHKIVPVVRVAAPPDGSLTYKPESSPATKRSQSEEAKQHEYGGQTRVSLISSPEEFNDAIKHNSAKVVVLMCKAKFCRPCKMFSRKYSRLADKLVDCVFLDVYGDENMETRQMMMDMKVKATPTFRIYRGATLLNSITGANEKKLSRAITSVLQPGEIGYLEAGDGQEVGSPDDSEDED